MDAGVNLMDEENTTTPIEEPKEGQKKELTLKQRKWLSAYMESGNGVEAALFAYDLDASSENDRATASSISWENLRKLEIPINELMEEAGLTDVFLLKKLKENLEATRLYGKDAIEGMDGSARNEAVKIALKIKGKLIDRVDHTTRGKALEPKIVSTITPNARAKAKAEADSGGSE